MIAIAHIAGGRVRSFQNNDIPSGLHILSGAIYNLTFIEAVLIYIGSSQAGTKIKGEQRCPKSNLIFLLLAIPENRSHSLNPCFMRYTPELRINFIQTHILSQEKSSVVCQIQV